MLEIAEEYLANHDGDRIGAAAEFAAALHYGTELSGGTYSLESAIVAAMTAFDLDPRETIRLTAALTHTSGVSFEGERERERDMLNDDDGSGVVS